MTQENVLQAKSFIEEHLVANDGTHGAYMYCHGYLYGLYSENLLSTKEYVDLADDFEIFWEKCREEEGISNKRGNL